MKPTSPLRDKFIVFATTPRPWLLSFSLGPKTTHSFNAHRSVHAADRILSRGKKAFLCRWSNGLAAPPSTWLTRRRALLVLTKLGSPN